MIEFTFVNFLRCFKFLIIHPVLHPVFGISSPWVCHAGSWGVGAATAWQHQTCFVQAGHAHSSMPSWVPCSRNNSWADGAPKVEAPAQHIGLLWGAKQGTNDSEKSQSSPREELKWCIYSVFQMYLGCNYHVFLCIDNVLVMYHGCIMSVIPMYCQCILKVLVVNWQKISMY